MCKNIWTKQQEIKDDLCFKYGVNKNSYEVKKAETSKKCICIVKQMTQCEIPELCETFLGKFEKALSLK